MSTTIPATYEGEVLKLQQPLPLPPHTPVWVTVEAMLENGQPPAAPVTWPDINGRLRALYGDKIVTSNPVLDAREEERY